MQASETDTIQISVNGERRAVPNGLMLLDLLRHLNITPDRVAVEYNRAIVRQPEWANTPVTDGANVEIVQFVGGG